MDKLNINGLNGMGGLMEAYEEAVEVEVYEYIDRSKRIHTDCIRSVDEIGNRRIADWELMSEDDYNESVLANASIRADFKEWYDDKSAKVLVIMVEDGEML